MSLVSMKNKNYTQHTVDYLIIFINSRKVLNILCH